MGRQSPDPTSLRPVGEASTEACGLCGHPLLVVALLFKVTPCCRHGKVFPGHWAAWGAQKRELFVTEQRTQLAAGDTWGRWEEESTELLFTRRAPAFSSSATSREL